MKVILVCGARPNFIKIAPLLQAITKHNTNAGGKPIHPVLVHTGQHYDYDMSQIFFQNLNLPQPDIYLGVGSWSHAEQTGKIMTEFERICLEQKPDLIIVFGDVNSTLACTLAAAKICIPIAHIEAGLRSFDRSMPEEINRVVTDQLSRYLFTTCRDADRNLAKEGILEDRIFFVGNTMIDCLLDCKKRARKSTILDKLGLRKNGCMKKYALVTLHRPSNVDDPETLGGILGALKKLSKEIPLVFPAHPRTARRMETFGLNDVPTIQPMGYFDFLSLMANASIVLTDSGGIQEETTVLGIPCLTLRYNTERPITIIEGTNLLVGNNPEKIINAANYILMNRNPQKNIPEYWDGKATKRIVRVLMQ